MFVSSYPGGFFILVMVCPPVWVRWVALLPHLLFIDHSFLTKIESSSHPFLALSSLSFLLDCATGLAYYSCGTQSVPYACIARGHLGFVCPLISL